LWEYLGERKKKTWRSNSKKKIRIDNKVRTFDEEESSIVGELSQAGGGRRRRTGGGSIVIEVRRCVG